MLHLRVGKGEEEQTILIIETFVHISTSIPILPTLNRWIDLQPLAGPSCSVSML